MEGIDEKRALQAELHGGCMCLRRALPASRCASHVHVYMCVLTQHASHRRVYAHARV